MSKVPDNASFIDWRIWLGLGLTALYLGYGTIHIIFFVDLGELHSLDTIGSFLEGAFAPLAFLWLVIGYFLQHKALSENNRNIERQYQEMRRSAEQAEIQAQAIAANEQHARRESFLKISALVDNQLEADAGLLYLNNQQRLGAANADPNLSDLWAQVSAGDAGVFSRRLLDMCYGAHGLRDDGWRLFFGNTARTRHTRDFMATFEQLLETAAASDESGMIERALLHGSAHGYLYRTIKLYEGRRRPDGRTTTVTDRDVMQ